MDQQNPTLAKIQILNTGKFEQWQFRIHQYLQHEHYALREVIEFGDSYEAPTTVAATGSASKGTATKKGRTFALTTKDMQKRKNDRNRSDLDTMSLDDLYNHLKVYESEVQKKSESNSQNMAFISSAKNSSGKEDVNTASIPTVSTNVSPASVNIGAVSISQDTACAYIALQSSGSQIKFEDITQIDEDDMKEMDIKWNMALLSIRADRFWKKTGKKISIQGIDVAGFDKSKVECFNCHKMSHIARECRAPRSQDRGRRDNYKQWSKVEEQAPKVLMAIDGVGWDWSFMANEEEDHALVADEEAPTEFALMAKTSAESEEGLGYSAVPPPAQVYSPPKKDMSWTEIPEFADDTITNYTRPSPRYSAVPPPAQVYSPPKKDMSWTEIPEFADDTITNYTRPSPSVENSPTVVKIDKKETARKSTIKYAKLYRKPSKKSTVRGNQRN
nr:hypothetical protein [Tanacetum cinerariifolium]